MIKITNLAQSYGEKQVLKNTTLTIEENKITALIGANGAGKSTLLAVIAKLLVPTSGTVFIDDVDLNSLKPQQLAKQISVLRQTNQINIRLTVNELVSFGRFPHSKGKLTKEDKKIIDDAISYVKLSDNKNDFLDQLSGGQRQRAYVAMTLAQDTKYIILDEPLNNLDMKYSVELMIILQNLVKDFNKTIVIVMHDINFAAAFCDHIVAMKDGVIVNEGTPDVMINKEILDDVFDHDFCIAGVNGRKVCIYYNNQVQDDRTDELDSKRKEGSL